MKCQNPQLLLTALAQTKIVFRKKNSRKIKIRRKIKGEDKETYRQAQKDELWFTLKDARDNHSMMGCSAFGGTEHEIQRPEGVPCGILAGHAYSIIDVLCI